jgi:hypothetical protein
MGKVTPKSSVVGFIPFHSKAMLREDSLRLKSAGLKACYSALDPPLF